jgi:hypothetical protein
MADAAILKSVASSNSAIYHPILMKFGTQTKKNILSPKNAKPEVSRQFPRWPTPPSLNYLELLYLAIYHPILMKLDTQTKKNVVNLKNAKPVVSRHNQSWPTPPS